VIDVKLFLLGAVGGAVVGYLIGNSRLEKEYENRYNEAVETARDFYDRKYNPEKYAAKESFRESVTVESEPKADLEGIDEEDIPEPTTAAVPLVTKAREALTDYRGMYQGPSVLEREKAAAHEVIPDPRPMPQVSEEPKGNGPTIISAEEFHENGSGFKQIQLTYYHGDDVVANAADNAIEETSRRFMFGDDVLELLREGLPPGEDTLYVRSPHILGGSEYEVYWEPGSYSELVGPFKAGSAK